MKDTKKAAYSAPSFDRSIINMALTFCDIPILLLQSCFTSAPVVGGTGEDKVRKIPTFS